MDEAENNIGNVKIVWRQSLAWPGPASINWLYNPDTVCLLRGTGWMFKYNLF
jgi:hypothetical protein